MKQIVINNKIEMTYMDDHIFRYKFLPKSEVDLETAKEMVKISSEWDDNTNRCNMVDVRDMIFMASDARKYIAEQRKPNLIAIAVILNSKFHKGFANLYLTINKPATPTKMFDNQDEAIIWLKEQLEKKR